jgi:hypothetical protein
MPGEWRRRRVVRGQGGKYAFGRLSRAAIGGGKEVESVVGAEEGTKSSACLVGLCPAFRGELYSVVGDGLVDIAVSWTVSVLHSSQTTMVL